jgi:hypothetical protein
MMHFRGRLMPWQQLDTPTTAISPAPRDAWEVVLRSDPLALESQSPAWKDAACAAGPFEDASRLYETVDGRLLVLPMLRRRPSVGALSVEGTPQVGASAACSRRAAPRRPKSPRSSASWPGAGS